MKSVFLRKGFLSFIWKFVRNSHNKPSMLKIPNIISVDYTKQ